MPSVPCLWDVSVYYYYDFSDNSRQRISGAQLNGVIVQAWVGTTFIKGTYSGDSSLKKFAESRDVVKDMGELKEGMDGL